MELTGNVQGLIDLVGGGSDVEYEQVLESGEKIGVITIDNIPTDIYAPEGAEVKVSQALSSGTKIASIEVDGEGVDLYAPTPEEPTSIEVTQVLSSGTKIATIEVDGESNDLYAPKSSIDYSTDEQIIGKWIDGRTLYQRTLAIHNDVIVDTSRIIANISTDHQVKYFKAFIIEAGFTFIMPYLVNQGRASIYFKNTGEVAFYIHETTFAAGSDFYITYEYTKLSDV